MTDDYLTSRLGLPLLAAGQAQKEVTHNEALALIDMMLWPVVESVGDDAPPAAPTPGACWIVGDAPTGEWTGAAGALAGWTAGGWRLAQLPRHSRVRVRATGRGWRRDAAGWNPVPTVQAPAGGATVDGECRAALAALVAALAEQGMLTS